MFLYIIKNTSDKILQKTFNINQHKSFESTESENKVNKISNINKLHQKQYIMIIFKKYYMFLLTIFLVIPCYYFYSKKFTHCNKNK